MIQRSWLDELRIGSVLHVATVVGCLLVMGAFAWWGRRLGDSRAEARLRRVWVIAMALVAGFVLTLALLPANFDPRYSLPLHLCDVLIPVAGLSLWTGKRALRAMTYFWAMGLSTQAFLTPILTWGPAHVEYWFFWTLHVQVVGTAVYDIVVGGFRPNGRDFLFAFGATLLYAAIVIPIDLVFGWNYGFLGDAELHTGSVLDLMPPWPWRLGVMLVAVAVGMAILWLIWPAASWLRARVAPSYVSRNPDD